MPLRSWSWSGANRRGWREEEEEEEKKKRPHRDTGTPGHRDVTDAPRGGHNNNNNNNGNNNNNKKLQGTLRVNRSVIYAITPTYTRPVQKAELTRLTNAFRQVPGFHWIVVEDAAGRTELVSRFLARCGVPHTHLHVFTPRRFKRTGMPRATEQRNAGLTWLRQHRSRRDAGVVFFADDDNTYSLELFEEVGDTLLSVQHHHQPTPPPPTTHHHHAEIQCIIK
ncbi:hypothetical protein CRUP_018921 [Coryphaenoides rupestris]|nr:hypothetical protein CRUP_018921 [Coryphaenoides rupestris]